MLSYRESKESLSQINDNMTRKNRARWRWGERGLPQGLTHQMKVVGDESMVPQAGELEGPGGSVPLGDLTPANGSILLRKHSCMGLG